MSDKLSRKELKAPDEFQKLGAQALPFFVQHQKTIVGSIIIFVVVGLGVFSIQYLGQRGDEKANADLGAALRDLSREVSASAVPEPNQPVVFKTEAEKNAAVIKSLTEFRAKNSGKAAATAALPLGHALLREGKSQEALTAFDDYLKGSPASDPLRPTALEGRGYALEAKKDYDGALSAFDQLAKENTAEFMKGMGLYHRARMLLLQGKTDEGVKQLQQLEQSAPGSSAARLAVERIGVLASQGVKIPEAPKPTAMFGGDAGSGT
ncbi:MAG: tetratricopeptide repeat protein [Archangiaceae bacterium]|nr:tetratricopeptide repeat protein [Archangiaceae bacterium]